MLTTEIFTKVFPNCKDSTEWVTVINKNAPNHKIDTQFRLAAFVAQCGHESAGWTRLIENLNYSDTALESLFSKYFSKAGRDAKLFARQPEKIANIIYANRMGNGDTSSGDGWKYRGRGVIQLTGKSNYSQLSKDMKLDVVNNPDLLATNKEYALLSALWFWNSRKLNTYADNGDIKGMTKIINGGLLGLEERSNLFDKILKLL